jgi:membrane protease subunit (stomatin/prohibitin family)
MGLLNFIRGQFIDVIDWAEQGDDQLLWKFPRQDNEIKMGAQLTVREGQVAIFLNEGKMADVFQPGRHELTTRNMPILTSLKSWKYGFDSPFKADVYFINTKQFRNMKWGTRNPVMVSDPDFSLVPLRAFGTFNFKVKDAGVFFKEFAVNQPSLETEELVEAFRSLVVTEFSNALKQSGSTLQEINMRANELGNHLLPIIKPDFDAIGIEVTSFLVENVSLPEEIQKELTAQDMAYRRAKREGGLKNELEMQNLMARASMSQQVGDVNKFMQFQAASGMNQPGGSPAAGMGGDMAEMMKMMMGMNMAQNMMQNLQQMQQPATAQPAAGADAPSSDDAARAKIMETLKQLGELKAAGVLTDAEFETKKAELLAKL